MDLRSKMRRDSVIAALAAAFGAALCPNPLIAATVLLAVQIAAYILAGALLTPMKSPWPSGTRRESDARRWMLAALCGGGMGACVLLALYALLSVRFGLHRPEIVALVGALVARACAIAVFDRRIRRPVVSIAGSAAVLGCVLTFLYPLF